MAIGREGLTDEEGNMASLTSLQLEILKWVQEGKTNEEIGTILGKSKWTIKYHLKNVMESLGVTSRTQAVGQAIGQGILQPLPAEGHRKKRSRLKVGIVGGGKGGTAVLEVFKDNPAIKVEWLVDKDQESKGIRLARELNIPVERDYKGLVEKDIDVIINVTGSRDVEEEIKRIKSPAAELMGGLSAMLMWQLADERRKRFEDREKVLKEHESLYHLGLIIENIDSMKDAAYAIVDYATRLTNMPAGSVAVFDEKNEDMLLVASKGFSDNFRKTDRWEIRKGGLTGLLFNQKAPIFIHDLREMSNPNPLLIKEGVRSMIASPLTVEGKIVGLLYVNDFKKRGARAEDVSIFSLLTMYAALIIERVKSIEEMRRLSIVDGLTDLYNHRYLMEVLNKEHQRASRHKTTFSIIMLDIDHFKPYNDSFGHLDGNRVLKEIARLLVREARATDTVGRFGGEEFCIVIPEQNSESASIFAERILREVSAYKFPNKKITVSAGVGAFPDDGKTVNEIIGKADERLYEAKKMGRNRVCAR